MKKLGKQVLAGITLTAALGGAVVGGFVGGEQHNKENYQITWAQQVDELSKVEENLEKVKKELLGKTQENQELNASFQDLQNKYDDIKAQHDAIKKENQSDKQTIQSLNENIASLNREIESLRSRINELESSQGSKQEDELKKKFMYAIMHPLDSMYLPYPTLITEDVQVRNYDDGDEQCVLLYDYATDTVKKVADNTLNSIIEYKNSIYFTTWDGRNARSYKMSETDFDVTEIQTDGKLLSFRNDTCAGTDADGNECLLFLDTQSQELYRLNIETLQLNVEKIGSVILKELSLSTSSSLNSLNTLQITRNDGNGPLIRKYFTVNNNKNKSYRYVDGHFVKFIDYLFTGSYIHLYCNNTILRTNTRGETIYININNDNFLVFLKGIADEVYTENYIYIIEEGTNYIYKIDISVLESTLQFATLKSGFKTFNQNYSNNSECLCLVGMIESDSQYKLVAFDSEGMLDSGQIGIDCTFESVWENGREKVKCNLVKDGQLTETYIYDYTTREFTKR